MEPTFLSNSICPSQCICSKYFRKVTCIHQNLLEIPKNIPIEVTELYLSNNKISKIKKDDLKGLYNLTVLSFLQNSINEIDVGAFNDQKYVNLITLRNNLLRKIDSKVFIGLLSLKKLFLTNNYLELPPSLENIPQITYLTLDNNKLTSADICKGFMLSNLSKLTTIIFSNNPKLNTIRIEDLACLSNIKKLDFSRCDLQIVDNNSFKLPQLNSLILSSNTNLKIETLQNIFLSLQNIPLTSLNVNDIFIKEDMLNNIKLFSSLNKLKNLFLTNIKEILTIKQEIFSSLKNLEILDLSGGSMVRIEENFTLNMNLKTLKLNNCNKLDPSWIKKFDSDSLEHLYLDNIPLKSLDSDMFINLRNLKELSLKSCWLNIIEVNTFQQLSGLTKLDLSYNSLGGSNLPGKIFESLSSLSSLDLSYNKMTTIHTQCNLFNGLISLKKLLMVGNNCSNLCVNIFETINNLQILDLSLNQLGQMNNSLISDLLMPLSNLIDLNLKDNRINFLKNNFFQNHSILKTIDLSHNLLLAWPENIGTDAASDLKIDMTFNKISSISRKQIDILPSNVSINLTGNPFNCYCDLVEFKNYINSLNKNDLQKKFLNINNYVCESPVSKQGQKLLTFKSEEIAVACAWKWILFGSMLFLVIIFTITVFLLWRYRWKIRLYLYLFKRKHCGTRSRINDNEHDFKHDVYVSYGPSESDLIWVIDKLMPRIDPSFNSSDDELIDDNDQQPLLNNDEQLLNNSLNGSNRFCNVDKQLSVYLEFRDLPPNKFIFDDLVDAIYNSRKVIICATKDFAKDKRRQADLSAIVQSRCELQSELTNSVKLILLEHNVDLLLPKSIHFLCDNNENDGPLEWEENNQTNQNLFWQRLEEFLRI